MVLSASVVLYKTHPLVLERFLGFGHGMLAHSSWESIPFPTCKQPGLFPSQNPRSC